MSVRSFRIGLLLGTVLCGATPATLVAQQGEISSADDVERMVRAGMVEELHARFHGGRTPEELQLLAAAQTYRAAQTLGAEAREEEFKQAEARYQAWIAVVEHDTGTDRIRRQVNASMARAACASMILSQWAVPELDEFEISGGRRGETRRLRDLLLKTRSLLDEAAAELWPLADELLEAERERDEAVEDQYLIAGIYEIVPRLQLDVRFNRAWTNLYIGMVDPENASQRAQALRAAERDFLELADSDQSGVTAARCSLGLAMTLREQRRYEQARRHFDVALQNAAGAAPLTAQILYESARGEIKHGRFEEARVILRPLLEQNSDASSLPEQPALFYVNLAYLWDACSYLKEAQLLEQTAEKSPAHQAVRARAGRLRETGLDKMNRLAARGGSWPALVQLFASETIDPTADQQARSPAELLIIARQHSEQKQYREAATLLQAALQRERLPAHLSAEILFELGICHYNCEELRTAAEVFARVAAEHPGHHRAARAVTYAFRLWARLAQESKRPEDYLRLADVLLNLVQSFPEHTQRGEAMWWLPVALQAAGRYDAACEHFGNVPADSPHGDEARYRRVVCRRLAFESARNALEPRELRSQASAVARELAEYAEQAYQQADTSRDPASLRAWSAAALVSAAEVYVSAGVGRHQRALGLLADYEQRYDEHEQIGRVLAVRIAAHRALGQFDEATQVVERFLQTVPADQAGGTLAVIARSMQEEVERLEGQGDAQAASRVAGQSIPIFEELERWVEAQPSRAKYLNTVRYGLARAYHAAGQHDSARKVLATLLKADSRDGNYQRLNALVLTAAADEDATPQRLAEARTAWGVMLRDPLLRTAAPQRYWEARYHYLDLMFREGKAAEVENAIRQDRVWYPDRDATEWDEQLDALYERAVARLGES